MFLLFRQTPRLERLGLYYIDLLTSKWEGVVEALRVRELFLPWDWVSLVGYYRHKNREWWPCIPTDSENLNRILEEHMSYIEKGGRHPSLPPDDDAFISVNFYDEMLIEARGERLDSFNRRMWEEI